jgi:hypothetical protein
MHHADHARLSFVVRRLLRHHPFEVPTMTHEHDDDMNAEVHEGASGEADQYAVVAEDLEEREVDEAATERLRDMQRNLEQAEGDDPDQG